MTPAHIFRTARPSLIGARVVPIDPAEQWALDELRRRRAAGEVSSREVRHCHDKA